MSVSEPELAAILDHCRDLLDAATQLNGLAGGRHQQAAAALQDWTGEHGDTFRARMADEAEDLSTRSRELRADADAWAQVWADTVNRANDQRREDAVEEEKSGRGAGEQFVDFFHGDDSDQQVRAFVPVEVPNASTRYAATGGLESI